MELDHINTIQSLLKLSLNVDCFHTQNLHANNIEMCRLLQAKQSTNDNVDEFSVSSFRLSTNTKSKYLSKIRAQNANSEPNRTAVIVIS